MLTFYSLNKANEAKNENQGQWDVKSQEPEPTEQGPAPQQWLLGHVRESSLRQTQRIPKPIDALFEKEF